MRREERLRLRVFIPILLLSLTSCGGGGGGGSSNQPPPSPLQVQLSASQMTVWQDGTPAPLNVTVTRPSGDSGSVTLSVASAPSGITSQISSPGSGNSGTVTFTAQPSVPAGNYTVGINASDSTTSGAATLSLTVGIVAVVGNAADTTLGENGQLNLLMSTSFQLASWADQYFVQQPSATTPLGNLQPQHIRMQVLERDIPQTSSKSDTWNFTYLDGIVNPIQSVGDHSPEFQIALGPPDLYDSSGNIQDPNFQGFAQYAANLVSYYNKGGFTDSGGTHHASSSGYPIMWWGIYNEPNINNISASQYIQLYNTTVPAMQAVDPTIKFVAVELADGWDEPEQYLASVLPGIKGSQVDVLATHFYATCNQADSDQQLFTAIDNFIPHIQYAYSQLQANGFTNVPVWMLENNVNADYDKGNGISACNGNHFVTDQRGTSAYFAAWRPTAFSKFAKAGLQALYHWAFAADQQYGEVSDGNSQFYLSYWVDYWLARLFASPPGATILETTDTEPSPTSVEVLATRQANGSAVVLVANHAVQGSSDNNGTGAARSVAIDVSALGSFSQASVLTLDAKTDTTSGPTPVTVQPAGRITINFTGYGVSFLALTP